MMINLRESGVIFLDSNGNGTVKLGPISGAERWHPATAHVQVSTNTNEAQATIYLGGSPTQSNFRDQTFSGSSGDASDAVSNDIVQCGQFIWAVWTNGDAGSQATLTVVGQKEM